MQFSPSDELRAVTETTAKKRPAAAEGLLRCCARALMVGYWKSSATETLVLVTVPILLVYLFLQRAIVKGVASGALKG